MRKRLLLVAILALALLPLMDHADQATCCASSSSLASTAKGAVVGDEAFFKLPTGPSNVMFLLDNSGSMAELPQCGDNGWGGIEECNPPGFTASNPSCTAAGSTDPTKLTCTGGSVVVKGTCAPKTDGYTVTGTTDLGWMEAVTPQAGYADPGRTNSLLWDCPLWGNGGAACGTRKCSGDGCLFDPNAYYPYGAWSISGSSPYTPSAKRYELDGATGTSAPNLPPCTALDGSGNPITNPVTGAFINLGAGCTTCMASRGFYIYSLSYVKNVTKSGSKYTVNYNTNAPIPLFKGTFLNANPPKFVSGRKVIKDVAWMDPANQTKMDQVRMGLSILNSNSSSILQAKLIVPVGPDKSASYPPTQTGFRQARQYLLSVLNGDPTKYVDAVTPTVVVCDGSTTGTSGFQNGFFHPASGSTPLGSAIFNVGQYFTAVSPSLYTNLFGATGCKTPGGTSVSCIAPNLSGTTISEFAETSAGRTNAPWAKAIGNTQCSFCWDCQNSSVVVVTDGSPNSEIGFPTTLKTYGTAAYSLASNCNGTYAAQASVPSTDKTFKCKEPVDGLAAGVPRIADWLHTMAAQGQFAPKGLRYDHVLGGKERALSVDSIGINIKDDAAKAILNAIAEMAGGVYQNTSNPTELANAVYNAVNRVTPRDISFSAATSNSLQTVQTAASQAFITRFRPNTLNSWEGHVFEAFLFDEFLNGCDPTKDQDHQPQVTCKGKTVPANEFSGTNACNGTFLIDLDCDQIIEDSSTGDFLKKGTTLPARLPWDAGQVLSETNFPDKSCPVTNPYCIPNPDYRSADETSTSKRSIFTWIGGKRVDFTVANVATIQPYLAIDNSPASGPWCTNLLTTIGFNVTAMLPADQLTLCAKQVIYYARGWDVLDQDGDGCGGPGNPKNTASCQRGTLGEERDRDKDGTSTATTFTPSTSPFFWKLGDISHSSPAAVQAPIDELRCYSGYEKQCLYTLASPTFMGGNATPMDASCPKVNDQPDCYQDYRDKNLARPRVLLVGGNDGMLHAFDAGAALTSSPKDWLGSYSYGDGTGAELWAFIPPDMLPRLKDLLGNHQYMVDGSVMLRDTWVDGSDKTDGLNTPAAPTGLDGTKQTKEFHTVAVFGRRSGGNQYTALDVTDPMKPTMLWSFPQSGSDDSRFMGQTWAEFAPKPPAIGPVRMAATSSSPTPDKTRGFAERWIVMLGGGYDPTLTLGRAVFTLDAWTGQTVWRFTDDDFKANLSFSGASAPSMFPVTAGISMVDIGDPALLSNMDGFFDTATWGDLGGNLWVARFWAPGVIDSTTKRVNNWYAARVFEELRRSDNAQYAYDSSGAARNELFYMTANSYDPKWKKLHTYVGSGNREQLMLQTASCSTDDLLGCCRAGCTSVTATSTESYGACGHSDTFTCSNGLLTHTGTNSCTGTATCAASPGNYYTDDVSITWTCPGASTVTATGKAKCDVGGVCTITPVPTTQIAGTFRSPVHQRFYGVVSFGGTPTKTFGITNPYDATTDKAAAKTFDQNRVTDVTYSGTCDGTKAGSCTLVNTSAAVVSFNPDTPQLVTTTCAGTVTKCTADESDPGWFYEYGDYCPLETCSGSSTWTDEKTGRGADIVQSCASWAGFRPVGQTTATNPCEGDQGVSTVYDYAADYITGAPRGTCYGDTNAAGRAFIASAPSVTAAPGGGTVRVDMGQGQVSYSVLNLDSGSTPTTISSGKRSLNGTSFYWLEVPKQLHQCRHVNPANCK
jgi:type IV pilus assembly protein PilY1